MELALRLKCQQFQEPCQQPCAVFEQHACEQTVLTQEGYRHSHRVDGHAGHRGLVSVDSGGQSMTHPGNRPRVQPNLRKLPVPSIRVRIHPLVREEVLVVVCALELLGIVAQVAVRCKLHGQCRRGTLQREVKTRTICCWTEYLAGFDLISSYACSDWTS